MILIAHDFFDAFHKFLKPGKAGEALLAETRITDMNARRAVVEVKLRRESDGREGVTGTVVQVFLREDAPAQAVQEETGLTTG